MRLTCLKQVRVYRRYWGALLLVGAIAASAADNLYIREIQQWRQQGDEFMSSSKSPLLLVGRFKIEEGESTLGSRAASTIVFPEKAPERVGTIVRRGREISLVIPAGTTLAVNDKPASGSVQLRATESPAPADRVSLGDFRFSIRPVGQDFYMFLLDTRSKSLQEFKEETWFPIDPAYRVTAQLVPYEHPKTRAVADTSGSMRTYTAPGYLDFRIGGQEPRLEALNSGDELFVMFRDKTSGRETCGGGRFMDVAAPKEGQIILDFNKAYNPYCAFVPYALVSGASQGESLTRAHTRGRNPQGA